MTDTAHNQLVPLSVIILTYNEELNIEDCLRSICDWAGEIFIVDSGSTDGTLAIAERYGAKIAHHPFETHSRQWSLALENLPLRFEWVLGLDADQRVMPELVREICEVFGDKYDKLGMGRKERLKGVDGFYVKRRQVFRGKWIKHGGYYPKYMLKIFRASQVWLDESEFLDHRFYVPGNTLKLKNDIIENNMNESCISFWIDKHNNFSDRQAREEMHRRRGGLTWSLIPSYFGNPDQKTLWLKGVWYRMPLYVRPFLYFFYRYFIRLGFLDGKQGFIFHFLQGFWFRLLVDIKIDELRRTGVDVNHRRMRSWNEGSSSRN